MAFEMPDIHNMSGAEFYDAVMSQLSRAQADAAMQGEFLLFVYGYEPVYVAGVGELWRCPDECGCLKARETALAEIHYKLSVGRGEDLPPEWTEPFDLNPDDCVVPDYPPDGPPGDDGSVP